MVNILPKLFYVDNYSDIFRIYLTILTVAMPVVAIEQTSVFPPSNCIIRK
jgi:hypothetical protein